MSDGSQALLPPDQQQQQQPQQPPTQQPQQMGVQVTTTPQDNSPIASPSVVRQYLPSASIKSPPFTHPAIAKPPTPTTQQDAPSPSLDAQKSKDTPENNYLQSPPTPKSAPVSQGGFQVRMQEGGGFVRGAPQQFTTINQQHASLQQVFAARQDGGDINGQLRDLLQKQQFKKLDRKGCQQRIWPPVEAGVQEQEVQAAAVHNAEATFRHPLPPGIVRPRLPIAPGGIIRQQQVQRIPGDIRLQGLDPRMRMLLQQQQQQQQQQQVRKLSFYRCF